MGDLLRRAGRVLLIVAAALLVPIVVAVVAIPRAAATVYPEPVPDPRAHAASASAGASARGTPRTLDPNRPVVAIVLGEEGANVADTLAPFEVFARAGAFQTVMVAPTADPVPLTGGLDVVPDLTLTELDRQLGGPADVIVVPQLHGSSVAVVDWLKEQRADRAPLVLSVCVGAGVIADAGFLDRRPATSNWLGLIGLRRSHRAVDWVEGQRFVDDGDVITSAGVLAGIDASLRVVERLAGAEAASRVREEIHWNGYVPGGPTAISSSSPRPADLPALLHAAFDWSRPTTAVLLTEGVGELELASAFRPLTELSFLETLRAVSADGAPIRSAHGLTFVPRSSWAAAAPDVDRLLVPGARPADHDAAAGLENRRETAYLHRSADEFAFDGALRDIATTHDRASATWVAKSLQYPLPNLPDDTSRWPWGPTLRVALLAAAGALAAWALLRLRTRRTGSRGSATARRRSGRGTPDAASRPNPTRSVTQSPRR